MKLRDLISPFYAWKRALEKPFTIPRPVDDREGAPRYRGFHINDVDKCVGCGTCSEICQNAAIDMVETAVTKTGKGDSGLRPSIDYGRCCWCALCVDVCPTGSLGMSNEYNWITTGGDEWVFTPGVDEKPWNDSGKGYRCEEGARLIDPGREKMPVMEPEERRRTFDEMMFGYGSEGAVREASRCLECGICVQACPTHMDVPRYIKAVRDGDLEEGLRILYDTNPFSESCGRVCTARCEDACPVGVRGEPIAIRWLKRYITDSTLDERDRIIGMRAKPQGTGQRVAVIGGGPAGLTAAYYLRHFGHEVTVFEQNEKPGGMLLSGIPEYRLPGDVLAREIKVILDTGVDLRCGVRVGKDISVKELISSYDAVFISVGAQEGTGMPIKGSDTPGVEIGLDFLGRLSRGERPDAGATVAVVGGGNTAIDVARSALRLGAGEVVVLYRRTEKEMPAHPEEVSEAREEGVRFEFLVTPKSIAKAGDRLGIECLRMELGEPDASGRRSPVPIEGSEFTVEADSCIMAIGQRVEIDLAEETGVKLNRWSNFEADSTTMETSVGGIFAAGDCETGPSDAIEAIGNGKKAAFHIDRYLAAKRSSNRSG